MVNDGGRACGRPAPPEALSFLVRGEVIRGEGYLLDLQDAKDVLYRSTRRDEHLSIHRGRSDLVP